MGHFRLIPLLALPLVASLQAQTSCPPLPEGVTCSQYHYHVSVWNVDSRTYSEVAATGQFVSAAACEKSRANALRENTALVDFVRTAKIDTSMMPNRFSACHCDRTDEKGSSSYVDPNTRTMQLRTQGEAAWSLRERLLSHDLPGATGQANILFGRSGRFDRFLRDIMPQRVASATQPRRPAASLLDSKAAAPTGATAIAANISLVAVPLPAAPPAAAAAAAKPAQVPSAETPATPPPNAPAEKPPAKPFLEK